MPHAPRDPPAVAPEHLLALMLAGLGQCEAVIFLDVLLATTGPDPQAHRHLDHAALAASIGSATSTGRHARDSLVSKRMLVPVSGLEQAYAPNLSWESWMDPKRDRPLVGERLGRMLRTFADRLDGQGASKSPLKVDQGLSKAPELADGGFQKPPPSIEGASKSPLAIVEGLSKAPDPAGGDFPEYRTEVDTLISSKFEHNIYEGLCKLTAERNGHPDYALAAMMADEARGWVAQNYGKPAIMGAIRAAAEKGVLQSPMAMASYVRKVLHTGARAAQVDALPDLVIVKPDPMAVRDEPAGAPGPRLDRKAAKIAAAKEQLRREREGGGHAAG